MINQQAVAQQIIAHLKHEITEQELIKWAENAFVTLVKSEDRLPDEEMLLDILAYLTSGNAPSFPLSWTVLSGFLDELGVKVRVVVEAS